MLNFDQIVPMAAQAAGDRPILAAPYPLPEVLCRSLAADGIISGYIANERPDQSRRDPFIAGWWTDRRAGAWHIRRPASQTVILLSGGPESEVAKRMLVQALVKGIRRILFVASEGSIASEINVGKVLVRKLWARDTNPIHHLTYEDAFEQMYALVGDRVRLPSAAFVSDRVLIMTGSFQPGGAERQAAYTAAGLARRMPGKVYVARTRSGATLDFYKPIIDAAGAVACLVSEGSEEFESPELVDIRNRLASRCSSLGFLNLFHMIFHHALLIREVRPEIVHTFQEYSNIPGGIAADLVGVPRIVLSGRSVAPDNFTLFQPYMAPAYHALLERRDVVFLNNSEAGARDYARWLALPRDRFRVIRNGIEFPDIPANSRASFRRELGIPENAIVVGSIIGFREEKRPYLWIEMARVLHRTDPEMRFLVFGEGPLLENCRALIESYRLSDVVKLPGLTADSWTALSAMDVFVLTSRLEGLPNVMIEAQAMGVPVVCTAAGGMAETFIEGETGFAVPQATPEALASAVSRLIDNPSLRMRMGANAQRHARAAFGIERMVDLTLQAYREAPEQKTGSAPDWQEGASPALIRLSAIRKEGAYCFVAQLPRGVQFPEPELWEDDHRLGPAASSRAEIRGMGAGRFRVGEHEVLFSSSDGADPRFSGRTYWLRSSQAGREFDDIVVNVDSITPENGHCYIASLGLGQGSALFTLWESDKRLGPGGCLHDEVRARGEGRYSVWGENLYFSTSDNSDPRVNQRRYILRRAKAVVADDASAITSADAPLERTMRHLVRSAVPRDDYVPRRVVHVGGSLGPGGAERQMLYTLTGLAQRPFESVQLLCYYLATTHKDRHDFYLPAFQAAGIPVRPIRRQVGEDDPGSMPPTLRGLRGLLPRGLALDIADLFWEFIELRPEIVHAWLDGNNVRAGLAAALAGVPRVIISGRNANPTHFKLYESYMDPAYKALLELPWVTMVNNSYAGRDDYAKWLGLSSSCIQVIHNGCDFPSLPTRELRLGARQAYGIAADAIVIGTVSRFAEEKRPQLFIEMARVLLHRHANLHFVFFGTGSMREEMQALVDSYGISERIRLLGITNNVWTSLAAMDVFVLTSRMEGLPNVLIEAQGAGLPVVSTTVGGAPETFIAGETGIGVPSPTAQEMAEAVSRLVRDAALRESMSKKAVAFAREQFGVDRMISSTLEVYWRMPSLIAAERNRA